MLDGNDKYDVLSVELENNKFMNLRSEVTELLINTDSERALPLLYEYLNDSLYNRRLEILDGIARVQNKIVISIIDKYKPKNKREHVVIAYIYCKYNIKYRTNFSYLLNIVKDKKYYQKGLNVGEENYDCCSDAVYYLELLRDKKALPALKMASEWADGAYGEIIFEAIKNIKNNCSGDK